MPQMQTISLIQPIARAYVIHAPAEESVPALPPERDLDPSAASPVEQARLLQDLEQQKSQLSRLVATVQGITDGLHELQDQTLAHNRAEIARLAVEIARKILMYKVGKGDYEIQAIVEEALKRAPTRQNIVVHLNPEDLPRCQQLQQENPQGPFADLELTADWSIGRSACLVETPKGIVKSFIEEHLEQIGEALGKAQ
jgi:flagellar biosynthesis/type III secretory pathway protein FliH